MNTTTNDQPHTADCNTCGASHVFDNAHDAVEWQDDHTDLGHNVDVAAL